MAEKKNSKPVNEKPTAESENLPVIYNSLLAYINSVVTFRFTTLGFFLAAVGLILAGTPSLGKYILLSLITIALYIIELRNRFLKNELEVETKQIVHKWHYNEDKEGYYTQPNFTTIFGLIINEEDEIKGYKGYNSSKDPRILKTGFFGIPRLKIKITHSFALDILYFSIFLYAVIHLLILIIPFFLWPILSLFRIFN
jgi:hypothetical protein